MGTSRLVTEFQPIVKESIGKLDAEVKALDLLLAIELERKATQDNIVARLHQDFERKYRDLKSMEAQYTADKQAYLSSLE